MSLLFIFTTAYVVALSGALMPGPLLTVTIKESLQHGWRSGLLISAGHGLTEITLLALFALGLNRLLHLQWISVLIGIGGGPSPFQESRTPSRPARSWTYCQATRPERAPRVVDHSSASRWSSSLSIAIPKWVT